MPLLNDSYSRRHSNVRTPELQTRITYVKVYWDSTKGAPGECLHSALSTTRSMDSGHVEAPTSEAPTAGGFHDKSS